MDSITIDEARENLASLIQRAAAGEDIVIADDGRTVARLVAVATPDPVQPKRVREFGFLAGQVWVADNFDDPLDDEFVRAFNGESP